MELLPGHFRQHYHAISQNRQQDIDRQAAENDYKINIKAKLEIELLHHKLDQLREQEVLDLTKAVSDSPRHSTGRAAVRIKRQVTVTIADRFVSYEGFMLSRRHVRTCTWRPPERPSTHPDDHWSSRGGEEARGWRDADDSRKSELLRGHIIPAVLGPKKRHYIVDHHHFARALLEERAKVVGVYVLADLSHLKGNEFWTFLDNSDWCHAYDENGRRRDLSDIPRRLQDLVDDPYRSLVGGLIRHGGCAKSDKPFSEFLWADFLRRRIKRKRIEEDYERALGEALDLARTPDARSLPGWCGVRS